MVGGGLHFTATLEWKPWQHQHSGRRRTTLYSNAGVETLSLTGSSIISGVSRVGLRGGVPSHKLKWLLKVGASIRVSLG